MGHRILVADGMPDWRALLRAILDDLRRSARRSTMRKRILVVDDVPDWRAQLRAILEGEYEVITADSYQSAMEVVRNRAAELVIVDLRLSPTDESDRQGMELLKQ